MVAGGAEEVVEAIPAVIRGPWAVRRLFRPHFRRRRRSKQRPRQGLPRSFALACAPSVSLDFPLHFANPYYVFFVRSELKVSLESPVTTGIS
jgi:hypothetical protein